MLAGLRSVIGGLHFALNQYLRPMKAQESECGMQAFGSLKQRIIRLMLQL